MVIYPPVTYHDMENDHFLELNHLFSWAMFNSYVILPQGISPFIYNYKWTITIYNYGY